MRLLPIVLMLSAGLMIQPVWADHRHNDDRRQMQRDDRRQMQRDDRRPMQRDDRRDAPRFMPQQPRQFQRDPREYQQYQRPAQNNFAPRGEPQYARPGNEFSAGDAARRAQQMNGGGRILAVDPNGPGYRVKVLKEGEVRVIAVPGG
ncbi:MAG: hypothetical protein JWR16_2395 [Nevskia sp.]|nr:hypothetical protein [Nevskia sp.]